MDFKINKIGYFKRWSRKKYAIFNSFRKVICIGFLSIVYFSGILFTKIRAQEKNNKDTIINENIFEIDEIIIDANIPEIGFKEFSSIVNTISLNRIKQSPVLDLHDLLEYTTNVDIRQRGKYGVQSDINIRGGSFDQTLILLNGININDPQTGHHNFNLPINIESVDHIEIFNGTGARIFGPNAFSGVINFVTGVSKKKLIKGKITGGQFGLFNTSVTSTFYTKKIKHIVQLGHKKSDGYIENTDFSKNNIFYQTILPIKKTKLNIQLGHSKKSFGANSFYTPVYPSQFEKLNTSIGSIKLKRGNKFRFTSSVYFRINKDRFELFRDGISAPDWYKSHNHHRTDVYGTDLKFLIKWKKGETTIGGNVRKEKIKSNVLGNEIIVPEKISGTNAFYTKKDSRTDKNFFINHNQKIGRLFFSFGTLTNWNTALSNKIEFYPGLDVSFDVNKKIKWFTSINRSLRLPTFTDLYFSGPTNIGNPNLKSEEAVNIESGFKIKNKGLRINVVVYKRFGKNMIDWVRLTENEKWQSMNFTDVNYWGIESDFIIYPKYIFDWRIPINRLSMSYSFNEVEKDADNYQSFYVLDYMKHKLDIDMHLQFFNRLNLNIHLAWQDRNGSFSYYDNKTKQYIGERNYKAIWLLDSKLYLEIKNYTFFIEGSNLFDSKYYDIGNVIQPGTWIRGGLSFQFNL